MKITVDVTKPELDAMEDKLVCWNLCEKHNKMVSKMTQEETYHASITCKKCLEINAKLRGKALHLWAKLFTEYLKVKSSK